MEKLIIILIELGGQIFFELCRWLAFRIKNWALDQVAKRVAEIIMKKYRWKRRGGK
jgi:hypothetical protein